MRRLGNSNYELELRTKVALEKINTQVLWKIERSIAVSKRDLHMAENIKII